MAGPLSRIELFCCSKNSSNPFSKEWCGLSSEKVLGWPRSLFGFSHTIWMDFLANQICSCPHSRLGFPGGSEVKNLPAKAGNIRDAGLIPGSGRPPWEGNGKPLQSLAWEIPWTEESGGLQSMGSQRFRQDWATEHARARARTHTHTHTRAPMGLSHWSDRRWSLGIMRVMGSSCKHMKLPCPPPVMCPPS